jgi:hypothetical protein
MARVIEARGRGKQHTAGHDHHELYGYGVEWPRRPAPFHRAAAAIFRCDTADRRQDYARRRGPVYAGDGRPSYLVGL